MNLKTRTIKIYSDGANLDDMLHAYRNRLVDGFTTNPTLMRKAGLSDYERFAKDVLAHITDMSISFEVFSDDFADMERQARKIAGWAKNVHGKIPITNTQGEFSGPLIERLAKDGIPLNVTAILTVDQVKCVAKALQPDVPSIVSVFAGRIADTGVDPTPIMIESAKILKPLPSCELLWASSREALNIVQAEECGCQIITVTPEILKKTSMFGKDLTELSRDTVRMFYDDGLKAGYSL